MRYSKASFDEKKNFSIRLKAALDNKNVTLKPSSLARGFNLRAEGAAVTSHAARKWLIGEAIPTHERILILARWLDVNAAWLRFGDAGNTVFLHTHGPHDALSKDESLLVRHVIALSKPSQIVVYDLVQSLMRLEGAVRSAKKPEQKQRT